MTLFRKKLGRDRGSMLARHRDRSLAAASAVSRVHCPARVGIVTFDLNGSARGGGPGRGRVAERPRRTKKLNLGNKRFGVVEMGKTLDAKR